MMDPPYKTNKQRRHWQRVMTRHQNQELEFQSIERDTLEWQIRQPMDTSEDDTYEFVFPHATPAATKSASSCVIC